MDNKLLRRFGFIVIGSFAVFNLFTLLTFDMSLVGTPKYGPYSIFASKEIFYAYHIWGIIIPIVTIYAIIKETRMLFFISLLLLLVLQFYPVFTSGPGDIARGKEIMEEQARQDSLAREDSLKALQDTTSTQP